MDVKIQLANTICNLYADVVVEKAMRYFRTKTNEVFHINE